MSDKTFSNEEMLLHEMVQTIIKEVSPETIILFGSRDRGDMRRDSDVNLLVVETEPFSPQRSRRKEAARLYMALRVGDFQGYSPLQPRKNRTMEKFPESCCWQSAPRRKGAAWPILKMPAHC